MQEKAWIGVLLVCLFSPQEAIADFVDALGVGARAIALGSAYTAVSDDLSAVYYNPAGLAQIEDHQIMLGYFWSKPDLKESSPNPSFQSHQVVPYELQTPIIAMVFNLDKAFKGKLPVHTRVGLINIFPDNFKSIYRLWDTDPSLPRWIRFGDYWDRVVLVGGFSIQAENIPWISLGMGFRFIVSASQFLVDRGAPGLDVYLRDLSGETSATGNIDLNVDTEASPTAGVMLTPMKNLRLGYCFHNSLSMIIDPIYAEAKTHVLTEELILDLPLSLHFEGYYWPQQHNWGISYLWQDRLLLSFDLSWFRWSRFTSESRGDPDPKWKDTLIPRFGMEYRPLAGLAVRFGYFFEPSPVPDQCKASNYIDNDRHVFSTGIGYTFSDPLRIVWNPMTVDLVFQYIHMPTRTTTKDPAFFPYSGYEASGKGISAGANVTFRF